MNKDIFFVAYIKGAAGNVKGMAVRIPSEKGLLPGNRIKALTDAARSLRLEENERLRTDMLVDFPSDFETKDLSDYLWADGSVNADRLVRHLDSYRQGKSPHLFQPRVGITVIMEEEFIGREKTLKELEVNVEKKRTSHLRAPRRYGKSSLMGRLEAQLPQSVMMELSDIGTLAGFLKTMLARCMRNKTARACLHNLPAYRSWPRITDAATVSQVFNKAFYELMKLQEKTLHSLLRDTMTALADSGIILLIDEFSFFLRDMLDKDPAGLKTFLDLFHRLRTRAADPLVAVFAGSSGLSTFIELFNLDTSFEDLLTVDVPPVKTVEARLLAEELFYGMEKSPSISAVERLVKLTGNDETVPYFVHALAHYTSEQAAQKREIGVEDVELAYYDRLLGPSGNICFRDFILRERGYPGAYRESVSRILKAHSRRAPSIVPGESLMQYR